MKSLVLVIVPYDAPDIHGMIDTILEPYRQDINTDGKRSWPYWDYWSFWDDNNDGFGHYAHECACPISEVTNHRLYATIFEPDGTQTDCQCPIPTQKYDPRKVERDFDQICRPVLSKVR
ncbi:MAG: hypothetical protein AAF528_02040 [Cyanobacteria bacterium P01_C01_bin.121]